VRAHACARINPRLGPIKCPTPRVSRFTRNRKDGSRRSAPKKAVRWISLFVKVRSLLRYAYRDAAKMNGISVKAFAALIVALSSSTSERDALRKTRTLDASPAKYNPIVTRYSKRRLEGLSGNDRFPISADKSRCCSSSGAARQRKRVTRVAARTLQSNAGRGRRRSAK